MNIRQFQAQQVVPFNAAQIQKFRKDFLTLMGNVKRLKDYKTAARWLDAMHKWRDHFDEFVYKHFIDALNRYDWGGDIPKDWAQDWEKKIRHHSWGLMTNLDPPLDRIEYTRKYQPWETEESLFKSFQAKAPKWERRVKRYARITWETFNEFLFWWDNRLNTKEFEVKIPTEEQVVLEGFNCRLLGYDPSDNYMKKGMDKLTAGLRVFRKRASRTFPWMLKHILPFVVNFRLTLDNFGVYHKKHIEIYPGSADNPTHAAYALAHEMGHHIYQTYLGTDQQKLWRSLIYGTTGDFDIRELLKKWPEGATYSGISDELKKDNPVTFLQLETLHYDPAYKGLDLMFRNDFVKYLEEGNDPFLSITTKPITGYAAKNTEEAFCEVVGLLCAYGPRTVDPEIQEWFKTMLPHWRFASTNDVTQRVASRYKQSGWWAIDSEGKMIHPSVDKGRLLNAVPGIDPTTKMYSGDGPLDVLIDATRKIDSMFRSGWSRPVTPEELRLIFKSEIDNITYQEDEKGGYLNPNRWLDQAAMAADIPQAEILSMDEETKRELQRAYSEFSLVQGAANRDDILKRDESGRIQTWDQFQGVVLWAVAQEKDRAARILGQPATYFKPLREKSTKEFFDIMGRVKQAYLQKNGGWWAITSPDSPGISMPPPVDKGGLMNAVPGVDPGDSQLYNGDGPADVMDSALARMDLLYRASWGRPMTHDEAQAVFNFCSSLLKKESDWVENEWLEKTAEITGVDMQDLARLPSEFSDSLHQAYREYILGQAFNDLNADNRDYKPPLDHVITFKTIVGRTIADADKDPHAFYTAKGPDGSCPDVFIN